MSNGGVFPELEGITEARIVYDFHRCPRFFISTNDQVVVYPKYSRCIDLKSRIGVVEDLYTWFHS